MFKYITLSKKILNFYLIFYLLYVIIDYRSLYIDAIFTIVFYIMIFIYLTPLFKYYEIIIEIIDERTKSNKN